MEIQDVQSSEQAQSTGRSARFYLKLLVGNKRTTFGFIIFLSLILFGLLAPLVAPFDPSKQDLLAEYVRPFWASGGSFAHPLGTDSLGRDIYSRLIYGFGIAAYIGFVSTIFVALIGTPIGLLSGYFRGTVDWVVSRVVDMWMSFPPVLLAIALILILSEVHGAALNYVILAIVVVDWTRFARVIRGEVFNIREKDYIVVAQAMGYSSFRIIRKEVYPNIVSLIIVLSSLEISIAITVEVLLSFVGLGIPVGTPSWGAMIQDGLSYISVDPWPTVIPLIVVVVVIVGLNLLGDGLREQLDPRLQVTR